MSYEYRQSDYFELRNAQGAEVKRHGREEAWRYCPICKGTGEGNEYRFSINIDTGLNSCKRASCGWKGNFPQLAKELNFVIDSGYQKKEYKQLPQKAIKTTEPALEYLKSRGISVETAERYSITTEEGKPNVLKFPFYDDSGKLQFIKYRNAKYIKGKGKGSKEWCEKDAKPILFGMFQCKDRKRAVITEGQIDSLTLSECGIENALSVPMGCSNFAWLDYCYDFLASFEEVIVFGDYERGEITLVDTLASKLPQEIKVVRKSDYLCEKDANDIYRLYGKQAIIDCIDHAEAVNVSDLSGIAAKMFDEKGRFLHSAAGDYLIEKHGACLINGALHIYNDGIYSPAESFIRGRLIELIPNLKNTQQNEVLNYLRNSRKTPERKVTRPELIPFRSKIYDIENDCFYPYSRDYVFLNKFPVDFDPEAPFEKRIVDTVFQIFDGDADSLILFYELLGMVFFRENRYRAAVFLYDSTGSNGKSTLLNVINQIAGEENTCHLSLQDTQERFRLIQIYGKALNTGDDIPATLLSDSSIFKRLVTGEAVTAEWKGKDAVTFVPYAKLWYALNEPPATTDKSSAFFSRIILLPLLHDFSGNQDAKLKTMQWTQSELNYLTRLAVTSFKRVLITGKFTQPKRVQAALAEYRSENDSVLSYLDSIDDGIDGTAKEFLIGKSTADVYQFYLSYCNSAGFAYPEKRKKFSRRICQLTKLTVKQIRVSVHSDRQYIFAENT